MYIKKEGSECTIELGYNDKIEIIVPASKGLGCVCLSVASSGKLQIRGDSSIVENIIGEGMTEKIKTN